MNVLINGPDRLINDLEQTHVDHMIGAAAGVDRAFGDPLADGPLLPDAIPNTQARASQSDLIAEQQRAHDMAVSIAERGEQARHERDTGEPMTLTADEEATLHRGRMMIITVFGSLVIALAVLDGVTINPYIDIAFGVAESLSLWFTAVLVVATVAFAAVLGRRFESSSDGGHRPPHWIPAGLLLAIPAAAAVVIRVVANNTMAAASGIEAGHDSLALYIGIQIVLTLLAGLAAIAPATLNQIRYKARREQLIGKLIADGDDIRRALDEENEHRVRQNDRLAEILLRGFVAFRLELENLLKQEDPVMGARMHLRNVRDLVELGLIARSGLVMAPSGLQRVTAIGSVGSSEIAAPVVDTAEPGTDGTNDTPIIVEVVDDPPVHDHGGGTSLADLLKPRGNTR